MLPVDSYTSGGLVYFRLVLKKALHENCNSLGFDAVSTIIAYGVDMYALGGRCGPVDIQELVLLISACEIVSGTLTIMV